jgi:hypothetical protein
MDVRSYSFTVKTLFKREMADVLVCDEVIAAAIADEKSRVNGILKQLKF